jgi:phage gpG-like protein
VVTLRWSVWGDDVIERELLRFEGRALNVMPAAMTIMEDIRDAVGRQFDSEGGYGSGGWAPLAQSTIDQKVAAGYPSEILHRTLRLRRSLTEVGGDNISTATPDGFVFGSNVEYGEYHQRGTVNMPQRRPLEFTQADKVLWIKRLQRYIVTGDLGPGVLT